MNRLQRALALALCIVSPASFAQSSSSAVEVFKLTDGDVLLTSEDIGKAKLAECQPVKGNRVAAQERKKVIGTTILRVTVLDGVCKGATGWVGISRLEATPEQQ